LKRLRELCNLLGDLLTLSFLRYHPIMGSDLSHPLATIHHWSRIRIGLLWIYRGKLPPGVSGFMDQFLTMSAWLVLKGSAETTIAGRTLRAKKGEWLFPKTAPRHQKFGPDTEILSIRFRLEWPNGDQLFDPGSGIVLKSSRYPELEKAARRMERATHSVTQTRFRDASLADRKVNFLQHLQIEKTANLWCEAVYRTFIDAGISPILQQAGDPRIQTVLDLLDTWPLNEPFKVEELASQCGLSRSNLERIAGKALGGTSKAYFDRRRIEHALQCLRKGGIPVKQIGIEVGFRHTSSFCAWFRGRVGCYPSEMLGGYF
jgi:AraC-like DNA-binding protein